MRWFGGNGKWTARKAEKESRKRERRYYAIRKRSIEKVRGQQTRRDDLYEYRVKHALRELGVTYEFQHPFSLVGGFFVVDFFFPRYCLAIEVDGASHKGRADQDRWRIRKIQEAYRDFRVRRLSTTWMNTHSWDDLKQLLREWL